MHVVLDNCVEEIPAPRQVSVVEQSRTGGGRRSSGTNEPFLFAALSAVLSS